jgi:N-formylglutamate amidohydrolase
MDLPVPLPAELLDLDLLPVTVARPRHQTMPVVFASAHSGRAYPASFMASARLDALRLRRSEDGFVDELFAAAPSHGAPLVAANFPRASFATPTARRGSSIRPCSTSHCRHG